MRGGRGGKEEGNESRLRQGSWGTQSQNSVLGKFCIPKTKQLNLKKTYTQKHKQKLTAPCSTVSETLLCTVPINFLVKHPLPLQSLPCGQGGSILPVTVSRKINQHIRIN